MADHRDRPDELGRPDRPRPYSLADLRSRVGRLPGNHPSSAAYRGGRGNGPANLRGLELTASLAQTGAPVTPEEREELRELLEATEMPTDPIRDLNVQP